MVKVLHLSDIHLGSGLSHGRINPQTGLNTRLEDFTATLSHCIDRAISEPVDLVLFGGDAFPDATPPPLHQEAFASQFRRLADANIPTVLLIGNHDQHGQGLEGNSLSIYRTLSVPNFFVGDRLRTLPIETRSGPIQVTTLPWLNRSALLANPNTEGLSAAAVAESLLKKLDLALEAETRQLDRDIPAILLAHAMVDRARYGAERHLAVGKGFTVPLSLLARPAYQYVALGHVHRHQVLCDNPPVIYPGSIERVDFSEETETKGFILANVRVEGTQYELVPLEVRNFCTIRVDLAQLDSDESPMAVLEAAIAEREIEGAVVRTIYRIRTDRADEIDDRRLHELLSPASSYSISPEVIAADRTRLPGLAATDLTPVEALEHYLQTRDDLAGLHDDMLQAARQLMAEVIPDWVKVEPSDKALWEPAAEQLSLLVENDP
ncbi:exonuclease subunit SbcD [Synechococcus sp. PCC 7336]|uniref:exonuclease subunit SbcD n=1 Tax=Synechococcus sp. PCC 7336 TaxID=195250 RepID=UPI00034A8AC9|nr:exonuclease subunit SbcD [Synechococcus sp. PCC 7336]